MNVFVVGGAVRDQLLGRAIVDRDWVVVGATPEEMLAAGYRPVGKDFPVFLHPETHEEHALARTERKTAPGYHGFVCHAAPEVTLDEDLARRDLTINAMALAADGTLVDPFGGQRDLTAKILRHVGPAFVEDPVRILRLARFAARFPDFTVASETLALMRQMVAAGEVAHLVPERVWQEISRGLMAERPSRMFDVLRDCGALAVLLPEVEALYGVPQRADFHPEVDTGVHVMMVIDQAARHDYALPIRFAALTHDLGKATTPTDILPRHIGHEERSVTATEGLAERLRVPAECRDLALIMARYHGRVHRVAHLDADAILDLLEKTDALRRPERFRQLLAACRCDYNGRLGWEDRPYTAPAFLEKVLGAVNAVEAGKIAQQSPDRSSIPARIEAARRAAIVTFLEQAADQPEQQ